MQFWICHQRQVFITTHIRLHCCCWVSHSLYNWLSILAVVHYTDMKPLVNSYIRTLIQTKWNAAIWPWQRYLPCESNIRANDEIPAPNQSWRGCHHPTSNWPYKDHQNTISCPEDNRLIVTIVVKHWPLTINSWSVQWYRNVVMNTTQLTSWILSLRKFLRLA